VLAAAARLHDFLLQNIKSLYFLGQMYMLITAKSELSILVSAPTEYFSVLTNGNRKVSTTTDL
jgi:hypothetical protein